MLSLNPMTTFGLPGKVAPYTFTLGLLSCISYQIEGNVSSKCGSLQSIGTPLFVFIPATAQLLLPLFGSCFIISATRDIVSFSPKQSESAVAGFTGTMPRASNAVPAGTIGVRESGTC